MRKVKLLVIINLYYKVKGITLIFFSNFLLQRGSLCSSSFHFLKSMDYKFPNLRQLSDTWETSMTWWEKHWRKNSSKNYSTYSLSLFLLSFFFICIFVTSYFYSSFHCYAFYFVIHFLLFFLSKLFLSIPPSFLFLF